MQDGRRKKPVHFVVKRSKGKITNELGLLSKLLASLMRNYFPKRPSGAPLHTLSKLYDVPVGFVLPPALFWGWILLILRSPKGGCCSISDDLSCFCQHCFWFKVQLSYFIHGYRIVRGTFCCHRSKVTTEFCKHVQDRFWFDNSICFQRTPFTSRT